MKTGPKHSVGRPNKEKTTECQNPSNVGFRESDQMYVHNIRGLTHDEALREKQRRDDQRRHTNLALITHDLGQQISVAIYSRIERHGGTPSRIHRSGVVGPYHCHHCIPERHIRGSVTTQEQSSRYRRSLATTHEQALKHTRCSDIPRVPYRLTESPIRTIDSSHRLGSLFATTSLHYTFESQNRITGFNSRVTSPDHRIGSQIRASRVAGVVYRHKIALCQEIKCLAQKIACSVRVRMQLVKC